MRAINRVSQLSRHVSRDCHECPGVTGDLYLVSIGSVMVRDGLDTPGDPVSYATSHTEPKVTKIKMQKIDV